MSSHLPMTQDCLNLKASPNYWKNNQFWRQLYNRHLKVIKRILMIKQLVENNTIMMNIFKKTNVLLKRVDHQIDKLLNYRHDIYFDFDHMM
jgi:hypothetical protein